MEDKETLLVVVTGGTGGHIYPALSIVREALKMGRKSRLIVSGEKIRTDMLDVPFTKIPASELKLRGLIKMLMGIVKSFVLLVKLKSTYKLRVVATGSYASLPILVSSIFLRIPFFLIEQNVLPGRTVRIFSKFSKGVFTSFEETHKYLGRKKAFLTGNPLREEAISTLEREEAKKKLGFDPDKPLILVLGGSLGAKRLVEEAIRLTERLKDAQFLIQTGRFDLKPQNVENKRVKFVSFIKEIGIALRASDLVISRAGGGAIAEMMINGRTGILIPYPYAKDDHQKLNALSIKERGGVFMLEEKELEKLQEFVIQLLENEELKRKMEKRMEELALRNSAGRILEKIEEVLDALHES